MLDRLPGDLQQNPLLRIGRLGLRTPHAEERQVEPREIIVETAAPRHRPARHAGLRIIDRLGVPALGGDIGDQVSTRQNGPPQQLGRG
jgi:hypothetical protein